MNTLICVLILIIVSFEKSLGQNSLNCEYEDNEGVYTCYLNIKNTNGLDNFTEIIGVHEPGYSDENVVVLSAVLGSKSSNIPSIICEKFVNVKTIEFDSIEIAKIGENSFKGCKKVEKISLRRNAITEINELAFSENLELNNLALDTNLLTSLPETVFANQLKMKYLYLKNNKILDLPNEVFSSLQSLVQLDLSGNEITNPKWFQNLEKLQKLFLNDNKIVELPTGAFSSLQALYYLTLSSNSITTIHSKSFGSLPNLKTVYLQLNAVNEIDEMFISDTGVSYLNMSKNVCADKMITDISSLRESMMNELAACFNNYKDLTSEN